MKHLLFALFCLNNIVSTSAQEIEIIEKTDSIPNIKEKGLVFINPKTDVTDYYYIAKVKITSNDFNQILIGLQKTANDLSANAFMYIEKEDLQNKTVVTLDLFTVNPELLKINEKNNESNIIYFFGNESKTQKFKIDNQNVELNPNEIYRFELPKDRRIKINKGGFSGMTVYHSWKENQPVIFYAFGSGNLSTYGNGYNSIGLKIRTGSIMELKSDFAYLLLKLKE